MTTILSNVSACDFRTLRHMLCQNLRLIVYKRWRKCRCPSIMISLLRRNSEVYLRLIPYENSLDPVAQLRVKSNPGLNLI